MSALSVVIDEAPPPDDVDAPPAEPDQAPLEVYDQDVQDEEVVLQLYPVDQGVPPRAVAALAAANSSLIEPGPVWAARASDEIPWLIEGALPARAVCGIVGDKGSLKTWLTLAMIVAGTTGSPFLGRYPVLVPGQWLWVQSEGGRKSSLARMKAMCLAAQVDLDDVLASLSVIWRKPVALDDPAFAQELEKVAPAYQGVVLDVFRDLHDGNENDSEAMGKVVRTLRAVANAGPTVVLVHHLGKVGEGTSRSRAHRVRGSTVLHGAFDATFFLERVKDSPRVEVHCDAREAMPLPPFSIALPADVHLDGSQPVDLDPKPLQEGAGDNLSELEVQVTAIVRSKPGCSRTYAADHVTGRRSDRFAAIVAALSASQIIERETGGSLFGRAETGLYPPEVPLVPGTSGTRQP